MQGGDEARRCDRGPCLYAKRSAGGLAVGEWDRAKGGRGGVPMPSLAAPVRIDLIYITGQCGY